MLIGLNGFLFKDLIQDERKEKKEHIGRRQVQDEEDVCLVKGLDGCKRRVKCPRKGSTSKTVS